MGRDSDLSLFKRFARWFKGASVDVPRFRNYDAAQINRLTSSWTVTNKTADAELRVALRAMRARSRNLVQNNDHAKKFISMVSSNVIGPGGIKLQSTAEQTNGKPDKGARDIIEAAWAEWGKKGTPTICGDYSWQDIQRVAIESTARDGEILIRKVRGFDNKYGFALQLLEPDLLDEDYNKDADRVTGNYIKMSVERDSNGRVVAYHLLTKHPGENTYSVGGKRYRRISADEIIHLFKKERPSQSRGVPWMHSAMTRLNMLGGYEEAELVAARVGSSKMGWFTREDGGEGFSGDSASETDIEMEAEPGTFAQLPPGVNFQPWDPQHPTTAFKDFEKAILRGIASGLNVSYNSLSSDLEGVNYSSIRQGVLDERNNWRMIQSWTSEHLHDEVFNEWLVMSLTTGALKGLPVSKVEKFRAHKWQPRGWGWVDPLKDIKSSIEGIDAGLKTRAQVMAEQGSDLEDTFKQLAKEEELAKKYGLTLNGAANNINNTGGKLWKPLKQADYSGK